MRRQRGRRLVPQRARGLAVSDALGRSFGASAAAAARTAQEDGQRVDHVAEELERQTKDITAATHCCARAGEVVVVMGGSLSLLPFFFRKTDARHEQRKRRRVFFGCR